MTELKHACTWVGCKSTTDTTPMLDAGRAWAHLCPEHKRQYDAEMKAMLVRGILFSPDKHRQLTYQAAGGEEAWKRYVFGPFAKGRDKPKILAGATDEPAATL